MKKSKARIVIYIICIIAGYLVISVSGLLAMINSSMTTQQQDYTKRPLKVSTETGWGQEVLEGTGRITGHIQMFDFNGQLLDDTWGERPAMDAPDPMDMSYQCDRFIDLVNKGKCIRRFDIVKDPVQNMLRVVYIYGAPVMCGDRQVGSVFGVQSPLYFSRTLKVFLLFFSAAYVIVAVSLMIVLLMRARYEEARQNYISNVTHALKTPVTAIKALAETLYDDAESDPEEQKIDIEMILRQADIQVDMVHNILRLSHLQTYGRKLRKISLNVRDLINDPVKKHLPACEQKNIELLVSVNMDSVPELKTDPEAVREVLDCLLDNAVKFTPEGGRITIDAKTAGRKAVIEVRDTGMGIEKDKLSRIFDRFYKGNTGNAEGNGLGLAIAKELIRHLNEKIWAESEPGKGTSVFFTVKINR